MTVPGGVLGYLARAAGQRVSGASLARALGLSRAAVHKRVDQLRRQGYLIDGVRRLGYRLDKQPDRISPEGLRQGWIQKVVHLDSVTSTQDDIKARAAAGFPEGTLVVADEQTRGRGRMGRLWRSPKGGLWYSLLLRPDLRPERVPALALVAALEWVRWLRSENVPAQVKWPNDIWVGEKKLAGLLTEMSAEIDRVNWVALGVGMNVANPAPRGTRVPAVSLKKLTSLDWPRQRLLAGWLERFAEAYQQFRMDGFRPFRKIYEDHLLLMGRRVSFEGPAGPGEGRVRGVDDNGRLVLETAEGKTPFDGGEVSLVRLQSQSLPDILPVE